MVDEQPNMLLFMETRVCEWGNMLIRSYVEMKKRSMIRMRM